MAECRARRPRVSRRTSPTVLERINPDAAGIDCGGAMHVVAVPPDRDDHPVQSFRTFTTDLHRLADWLVACGVTTVALESTGVFWIPIYEILEARGIAVQLVNARHVRNLPGRKTDVADAEWLRDLHSVGLVRGSFRPTATIVGRSGRDSSPLQSNDWRYRTNARSSFRVSSMASPTKARVCSSAARAGTAPMRTARSVTMSTQVSPDHLSREAAMYS